MLDGHGNYLYCQECIVAVLDVHRERLHKQRLIKQRQKHQPIIEMTKEEVKQHRLEEYVIRDDDDVLTFSVWWKGVADDDIVEIQFPHDRHGLAGR